MKSKLKEFLLVPNNSSKEQIVKWLHRKQLFYNLLVILISVLFLSIIYTISPSLINFFTIVLTLLLLLCLNISYYLYIMFVAFYFRNRQLDIINNYLVKNSFNLNLIFAVIVQIAFSLVLIILKFS